MRLFYTGASKGGEEQEIPSQSLGGYVSSSPLPNGSINNLFGGISQYGKQKALRQVRAIVLKNESGATVNPVVWYDNVSSEPITNYRFAFVALAQSDCGWFMETIDQQDALPINAQFIDPRKQANAVSLPALPNDGYIGMWIERTFNKKNTDAASSCENLLDKFNSENSFQVSTIQTPADVASSLDGKHFLLNTISDNLAIWYSTGAGALEPTVTGKEMIKVTILPNDTADAVALKTSDQLNLLIDQRGDIESTVAADTITITATQYGGFPIPVDVDAGVTVVSVSAGSFNGLETEEDMEIYINY